MATISKADFEALWEEAQHAPREKKVSAQSKIEVDLRLNSILDRYIAFARKADKENKVQHSVFDNLVKEAEKFKKGLAALDNDSVLDKLTAELMQRIGHRFR